MQSHADVIVVGAGVIGCAIAHELSSRGASVLVVDRRDVGLGATQASAGVLAPHIEGHQGGALLDLCVRSLDLYDAFVGRVEADAGAPVEYERCGTLEVALDAEEARRLHDAPRGAAAGDAAWLDTGAVAAGEPLVSGAAIGGRFVPGHGYVAAQALVKALARAASARGAVFRAGADAGALSADGRIVLAAGAWTSEFGGRGTNLLPIEPVRGQLVRLRMPARGLSRVVWGSRCYLVPWRDGTVLVGATTESVGFDERSTADGVRGLLTAACELVPALRAAEFGDVRVGLRPATSDELPIVGRLRDRPHIVVAAGHYRNGILLAPLTARLVADLVLEGREDPALAALSPERFGVTSDGPAKAGRHD